MWIYCVLYFLWIYKSLLWTNRVTKSAPTLPFSLHTVHNGQLSKMLPLVVYLCGMNPNVIFTVVEFRMLLSHFSRLEKVFLDANNLRDYIIIIYYYIVLYIEHIFSRWEDSIISQIEVHQTEKVKILDIFFFF